MTSGSGADGHKNVGRPTSPMPSLDGLRGISIALVLLYHLSGTQNFLPAGSLRIFGDLANFGVRIFFVISGFLITGLLLKEFSSTGRISLKNFYMRRFLRIFPAFYTYLAVVFVLAGTGLVALYPNDAVHALSYTVNFHYSRSWYIGHTWSLSVEEQFYLLWPLTLRVLGPRRGFYAAGAVMGAAPLIRMGVLLFWPAQRVGIGESFPTIADAIAAGCLLAGMRAWLESKQEYRQLLQSRLFFLVPLAAILANVLGARPKLLFGETLMNVALAVCIHRSVMFPSDCVGKILNWRPLAFVGVLSYSLYLWQQPFLNRHSHAFISSFPYNIVLAFSAALASYYIVERPFLKLKARFSGEGRSKRQLACRAQG